VTTYDRLDRHYDSAIEAGQPPENAFTHIGLYLAWIIRHDLHDPATFPAAHVAAVKTGEMTGSDLSDDIDAKLVPAAMNAEGRAFSDARYAEYLVQYQTVFADLPDYAVTDDPTGYARIAPAIDSLYANWIADGRPAAFPDANAGTGGPVLGVGLDEFGDEPEPEVMSRMSASLEALIPANLTDPPLRANSVRASTWGSSLLNRALRRLGVDPKDATVVIAMGGSASRTLTVMLYDIPGVAADRLVVEIEPAISLPPNSLWGGRQVAGRQVRWATGSEFSVAFWALDGLIVHVAGSTEDVEGAIPRLP